MCGNFFPKNWKCQKCTEKFIKKLKISNKCTVNFFNEIGIVKIVRKKKLKVHILKILQGNG